LPTTGGSPSGSEALGDVLEGPGPVTVEGRGGRRREPTDLPPRVSRRSRRLALPGAAPRPRRTPRLHGSCPEPRKGIGSRAPGPAGSDGFRKLLGLIGLP
jgi:hypothetical protein